MANVKEALDLLGGKPCSIRGTFYFSSNSGKLFKVCGDSVSYAGFSNWFPDRCKKKASNAYGRAE